jgi:DNA-binding transcriptional LysR family regulator
VGNVVSDGIALLARRNPGTTVEMVEMRSPAQLEALARGEIDVAIAGVFSEVDVASFESVELRSDAFDCALVAPSHPLADRSELHPTDLNNEPFLYAPRSAGPKYFDVIIRALDGIGVRPRVGPTFDGPRAMWKIASEGGGWLIGLHSQRAAPPPGLVGVPIAGLHLPWAVRLIWRSGAEPQSVMSVVSAFREAARK